MSGIQGFMMIGGVLMLLNSTFSMLQYRRHVQSNSISEDDDIIVMPLDIKVEVLLGLFMGILGALIDATSNLKVINQRDVMATTQKTYELAFNQNRSVGLRNIQKTRGCVIWAKDDTIPDAHAVLKSNKSLSNIVSR